MTKEEVKKRVKPGNICYEKVLDRINKLEYYSHIIVECEVSPEFNSK